MDKEKEADLNLAPAVLVQAHIYKVDSQGTLIYCSNEYEHAPAKPRDFTYVGTANVNEDEVKLCEFE